MRGAEISAASANGGAGAGANVVAKVGASGRACADASADRKAYSSVYASPLGGANGNTNVNANSNGNTNGNVDANAKASPNCGANGNPNGNGNADGNSNGNGNADSNSNGNANGNSNSNGSVDANARAGNAKADTATAAAVAAAVVRDMRLKALTLAAVSGFARAAQLTEVSLNLCNACRAGIPWSLHVSESTPKALMDHLRPGSSMAMLRPVVKSRLERPRSITKVRVDANDDVTSASWPSSMKHLAFGPGFNRAVEGMILPGGLLTLSFGVTFNQVRRNYAAAGVATPSLFCLLVVLLFPCFYIKNYQ